MPLANGRPLLAIPGPTPMPEAVLREMSRPMANIYNGALIELTEGLYPDLKALARTKARAAIFISNGHGTWEASVANTLSRGDKVLILDSGRFALGWAEVCVKMGVEVELLSAPVRHVIDPQAVEDRLRADTAHEIKSVLLCQIDTASGTLNDVEAIGKAIRAAGHPALYQVDCMASLGCVPFHMDAWGVDVALAGSQKGLMTPPGLGFVWASDRAWEHSATLDRGVYFDWAPRMEPEIFYQLFCGTAPVSHLYALRAALDIIEDEGLEAVWARHAALANGVRAAVQHWGSVGPLELNVLDERGRADSVTTILSGEINAEELRAIAETKLGVTLGIAIGMDPKEGFRIGHMGYVNAPMVLGALGATEMALGHMGAAHATGGVEAAMKAMRGAVA